MAEISHVKELTLIIRELSRLDQSLKWAVQRKIIFEAGILALCDRKWDETETALTDRIAVLERRISDLIASGIPEKPRMAAVAEPITEPVPPPPTPAPTPVPAAEPPAPAVPASPKPKPVTQKAAPAQGVMQESDELDWKEFLSNISAKGQASLSALIKINSRGVLDGKGNLILVFSSPVVKDMIVKKEATDILSESASSAYGMALRVVYATKQERLDAFAPPAAVPESKPVRQPAASAPSEGFDSAVQLLRELSEQEGFQVEEK